MASSGNFFLGQVDEQSSFIVALSLNGREEKRKGDFIVVLGLWGIFSPFLSNSLQQKMYWFTIQLWHYWELPGTKCCSRQKGGNINWILMWEHSLNITGFLKAFSVFNWKLEVVEQLKFVQEVPRYQQYSKSLSEKYIMTVTWIKNPMNLKHKLAI